MVFTNFRASSICLRGGNLAILRQLCL
jgi:hypothetical protein